MLFLFIKNAQNNVLKLVKLAIITVLFELYIKRISNGKL